MVIEAFIQALQYFGDLQFLLFMAIGTVAGIVIGAMPAIGNLVGLALFLPFAFALSPQQALPFMVSMSAVAYTSGSIPSILVSIPGTGPNAATIIDGFPMCQRGESGRALGAALTSSGLGGVAAVFLALATVPLVLPMIVAITTADMVFVILLGISFIAVLGRGSMLKGLVSGGLGLLIAFIGFQATRGVARFTFDSVYLYDGIPLIPIILGLFALPEVIILSLKGGAIARAGVKAKGMHDVLEGAKDVFRHWGLWLRSTIIGYVIGVIPGVGGEAATFVAYGQAKHISKNPEKFGTGCIEGVIAPEGANNAKEAGALLTTLALGIPGSAAMALVLAGLLMVGLIPGPQMLTEHLDLSLSLIMAVAAANVIGAAVCIGAAPQLVKITFVPSRILVPLVVIIAFVGAFAYKGMLEDIIVTIIFTVMGLAMRKFGFSRPALILAFILGFLFEKYLFIAYAVSGPLFWVRPISLVLIFIIVVLMSLGPIRCLIQRWFSG